ncbi:DNA repair protein [Gonapodya prolifera JEL478]|uniref:DNA repair protein REV1 n=1 Tax=Gonapodya prolifera (strain JEL478) TaxID=1344416 RepID=A0A139A3J8_GONPJ|nr:DNA repair protein [Gonapodya prolifera JEL478]|eukprot:KXS11055.1 DNA repair protein [Gonapodya prolifera JEL478]
MNVIAGVASSGQGRGGSGGMGGGSGMWNDFGEYMREKNRKLKEQDRHVQDSEAESGVLKGIKVYIDGWTNPPAHDLKKMILKAGGEHEQYFRKSVCTHVVASNITARKVVEWGTVKIVTPNWITDSVAAGKILPWNRYKLVPVSSSQQKISSTVTVEHATVPSQYRGLQGIGAGGTGVTGVRSDTGRRGAGVYGEVSAGEGVDSTVQSGGEGDVTLLNGLDVLEGNVGSSSDEPELDAMDVDLAGAANQLTTHSSAVNEPSPLPITENPAGAAPSAAPVGPLETSGLSPTKDPAGIDGPRLNTSPSRPPLRTGDPAPEHHPTTVELQSDWARKNSTLSVDFLDKFYAQSRLHLISTQKLELQEFVENEMQGRPPVVHRKGQRRIYMHVDMDCFFASIAIRERPELDGKPVAVTHGSVTAKDSGADIASCNYEARRYGLSNGMWLGEARRKCPELVLVPYEFDKYVESSKEMYRVLMSHADDIEAKSIDEAIVDVTSRVPDFSSESALQLAETIRNKIRQRTGCNASVGVSCSILLARIATKKAKPNGAYFLSLQDGPSVMRNLKVDNLPGVGWKTAKTLDEKGIKTIGDLAQLSKAELQRDLGEKIGESLYNYARGIDDRVLKREVSRSTVSAECNWGVRFETNEQLETFLSQDLSKEVVKRLNKVTKKGAAITLKLMKRKPEANAPPKSLGHGWTDSFSKTRQLGVATDDPDVIGKEVLGLLRSFEIEPMDIRGLGISMTKLVEAKSDGQKKLDFFNVPIDRSVQTATTNTPMAPQKDGAVKPDQVFKVPLPKEKKPAPPRNPPFVDPPRSTSSSTLRDAPTPRSNGAPFGPPVPQPITPSQIDPSVLSELPADLRAEIMREYGMKGSTSHGGPSASTSVTKSPPSKRQKVKKTDPGLPVDRNKGKGVLPMQNFVGGSRAPQPGLPPQSQLDVNVLNELPEDIRRELEGAYGNVKKGASRAAASSKTSNKASAPLDTPKLMGVPSSDMDGVRALLDRWVLSSSEDEEDLDGSAGPLPEDTSEVRKFLQSVVKVGDLECAEAICIYLKRRTEGHAGWDECVKELTQEVQTLVTASFGRPLKRLL